MDPRRGRTDAKALRDPDRLAAVERVRKLSRPPDEAFDRLTRLAVGATRAPTALISLIAGDRQEFLSSLGMREPWASRGHTPLSMSVCRHVVAADAPMSVEDARRHPLLQGSLAIPQLGVGSYAGVPLRLSTGEVLGAFCVIDAKPRGWTQADLDVLADLAAAAVGEIEARTVRQGEGRHGADGASGPRSRTARAAERRERLVQAAWRLFHAQGAERPTLAEIAVAADIPPGSVYTYFRTKEELMAAVVERETDRIRGILDRLDARFPDALARLHGMVDYVRSRADHVADEGSPALRVSHDLTRALADTAPADGVFSVVRRWARRVFEELGAESPDEAAEILQTRVTGALVLAEVFAATAPILSECRRLDAWLDSLVPAQPLTSGS